MATSDILWGAVSVLAGIVWRDQSRRITALEAKQASGESAVQALKEAVVKLTVTVEHLTKQLELREHRNSEAE